MTNDDTIQLLNDLHATCRDGELGYRNAAQHVNNTQMQTVFLTYAAQRDEFARHLRTEIERLGGVATESGTVSGTLHRGWVDLKSALTGGNAAGIVAACETGEDSAVAAYERVWDMDISGETKALVEKQWRKIQEAHAHMLRLKEEAAAADFPSNEATVRE